MRLRGGFSHDRICEATRNRRRDNPSGRSGNCDRTGHRGRAIAAGLLANSGEQFGPGGFLSRSSAMNDSVKPAPLNPAAVWLARRVVGTQRRASGHLIKSAAVAVSDPLRAIRQTDQRRRAGISHRCRIHGARASRMRWRVRGRPCIPLGWRHGRTETAR
jgi:hypothetical protein